MFLCPAMDKEHTFWTNLAKTNQNCLLKLKLRIETNWNNSNIGQIWSKKIKFVCCHKIYCPD